MRNALTAAIALTGMLGAAPRAGAASDDSGQPPSDTNAARQSKGIERASVQVRLYDSAVVPAADQTVALRAATGVLAAAGIDITWLACGLSGSAATPEACAAPLARNELAVRLVRLAGTPSARGQLSLGYSLVDLPAAGGTLATIYVDRVQWLASKAECAGARVRPNTAPLAHDCASALLLGLAVAHEVGHLLLGTNAHGRAGLMRAVWSQDELQRNHQSDWLFSAAEGATMRRALLRRVPSVQMAAMHP